MVELGVRELSVAPAHVPAVKRILSSMTLAEMQARAQESLKANEAGNHKGRPYYGYEA